MARAGGAEVLEVRFRNAGAARAYGLDHLDRTTRADPASHWLATTDADSEVPVHWFERQLALRAAGWHAVAGTVQVDDWSDHADATEGRFAELYGVAVDGHPHVHGANLGLSAAAYRQVGGFPPLALAEDHALVDALERCGLPVARAGGLAVRTSARQDPRAAGGFGDLLRALGTPQRARG